MRKFGKLFVLGAVGVLALVADAQAQVIVYSPFGGTFVGRSNLVARRHLARRRAAHARLHALGVPHEHDRGLFRHRRFHEPDFCPPVVITPTIPARRDPFAGSLRGGNSWYALSQMAARGEISYQELNRRMYGRR